MEQRNTCPICNGELEKSWHILCSSCFRKMCDGQIVGIKYDNKWLVRTHEDTHEEWKPLEKGCSLEPDPVFTKKEKLVTDNEKRFLDVIYKAMEIVYGKDFRVFPQVALSSIIQKKATKWRSELFRSVDFLVTSLDYRPLVVIEINDQSHDNKSRIKRDNNLRAICREAELPILFLDGCKDVSPISPEELGKKVRSAQWDIANITYPTFYYKIQKPEKCLQLSQDTQILQSPSEPKDKAESARAEARTESVHKQKSKKKSGKAKGIISILVLVAILFGLFYLIPLFREKGQNDQKNESNIDTFNEIPDTPVDASCFNNSSPILLSLCSKSLTYSQESEQDSIESGLEVPVGSTIRKAYFMKAIDAAWPHIYYGKNVTVNNAVVVISNYRIQYPHNTNWTRETWLVWVYPNFTFDDSGNLNYETEHEYYQFLASDSIEEVQAWLFEEYRKMDITELDFAE